TDRIVSPSTPVNKGNFAEVHSYFIGFFPSRRKWFVLRDNLGEIESIYSFNNKHFLSLGIGENLLSLVLCMDKGTAKCTKKYKISFHYQLNNRFIIRYKNAKKCFVLKIFQVV